MSWFLTRIKSARWERFQSDYGLSDYDAGLLTASRALADFFERTVTLGGGPQSARTVANWILRDLLL